ncbi:MAG: hypothetical protein A2537_01265 [Candidatus Magasanikbacteria bacterium RIFOXYD2_FULL_36_9]|uniref:Phosphotyrosine protein phosphatase I domain-containing protein n=1 Tax=Candidatus Magasanikbacteria bacterium RIFOXYD2_FULL_36_9 TaxID=1798707 RepID=A0A1F6NYW7_9BACT|nr:MAG: hypothetical protein A2537_01265 [Candidatus Magasanikbacteria bacterium RIFOXYD2_FULL_36_9]
MKFLFICKANVGRSQMAEAIFNSLTKVHVASSAGLNPPTHWEGEKLSKTKHVAPCMLEIGINVSEKISKRLTEPMVKESDRVVVVGEKEDWPIFLKEFVKLTYWDIVDPGDGDRELHITVRDQIREKVVGLVKELEK